MSEDFEKRRIAAAFQLSGEWEQVPAGPIEKVNSTSIWSLCALRIFITGAEVYFYSLSTPITSSPMAAITGAITVGKDGGIASMSGNIKPLLMPLSRGLFCLGISIAALEAEFGPLLSYHNKLAYREEMPREFWPESWKEPAE